MSNNSDTMKQPNPELSQEFGDPGLSAELVAAARLVVVSGPGAGQVYTVFGRETWIGRAAGAHIRLDDRAASGRHAKLVHDNERLWIMDLGSTNGTSLNGQRLTAQQTVELHPGDAIQIGETVLSYADGSSESDRTQQLAPLATRSASSPSTALALPEARALAQLLQAVSAAPEQEEARKPTLDDYIQKLTQIWAIVRRNWVPLFAATALCALIGNLSVFVRPPPSEALFRLRLTPKSTSEELFQRPESREDRERFYYTAEQNFTSRQLVDRTLRSLGVHAPSKEQLDLTLRSLALQSIARSTYEGKFTHADPEYAVRYLEKHIENYLNTEIDKTIHVVQAEVDFLTRRLQETETELRRTEQDLQAFKDKHFSGLPEYARDHVVSREALYARRADLSGQLQRANLELQLARKQLREGAPLIALSVDSASSHKTSLAEAQRHLGEARAKGLGDQHPDVIRLTKQIRELETLADRARNTSAKGNEREAGLILLKNRVGELEVAARATQAELGQVNGELGRIDSIVNKMPKVEADYAELTRSYESAKGLHARLFEKLRSSQLQLDLERTSAQARYEILAPPDTSGVPVRSALLKRTAAGIAGGLMLGVALSTLFELRRYLAARRRRKSGAIVPEAASRSLSAG